MINFILSILMMSHWNLSLAAPHPAHGASELTRQMHKKVRSKFGFELNGQSSEWELVRPSRAESLIYRIYRGPFNHHTQTRPKLTVRYEKLKANISLKAYVKHWVREYPYYGFRILNSKLFSLNKADGYLVDMRSREHDAYIRQTIFYKKGKAIILTCSDHRETFKSTIKECNKIIRTFNWL